MMNAFRTGTVRNVAFTKPYMHNGIFQTLEQVIDLYDAGGGFGKKLVVDNQTLSPDSLHLTKEEKVNLIAFIHSLNENVIFETPPVSLPAVAQGNPVGEDAHARALSAQARQERGDSPAKIPVGI